MPILNLETKDKAQELIKAYLETNASDILADKINNGVLIEKDGKKLINRKTLDGFNVYSFQTVLNGTTYSKQEFTFEGKQVKGCVLDDPELFNMAIHYFEENSIEGTLYNEDGSEYKPPKPVAAAKAATTYTPPTPKPRPQMSLLI